MSDPEITTEEIRHVINGATVHVGVCRVVANENGHFEVYGEGDHRIGIIRSAESPQHAAREVNTLIIEEHSKL